MAKLKWIIVTILVAVPAFLLGPVLWQPPADGPAPGPEHLPFLIAVQALEAVAMGVAVAFLLFGWKWVRCVAAGSQKMAWLLYVSIAWVLGSWWVHDNLHMSNAHDDWWRLIGIEYGFHVTLIAAGFALAWSFFKVVRQCQRAV